MVTCGGGEYIDVAQLGYHNCDANDLSTVGRPTVVEKYLVIACSSPLVVPPDEAFRFGLGATAIPLCPVGFDKDITGICTALQRSNRRINVVVTFSTLSAFVGIVASKPIVLHFVGHAVAPVRVPAAAVHLPACLLLESNGFALLADAVSLRDWFFGFPDTSLVFLAACESLRVGKALVSAGVCHVIATTCEVFDDVAVSFYEALFAGESIAEAFKLASLALGSKRLRNLSGHAICSAADAGFVLLPVGETHGVKPFFLLPKGFVDFKDAGRNELLYMSHTIYIVGREIEAAAVVDSLSQHRAVLIHGVGKSVVAVMASRYMNARRLFAPVVWVNVV